MTRKLNVTLTDEDFGVLSELALRHGVTLSAFVREALRVGVWYEREVKGTRRTLVLRDGDRDSDLVLL